MILVAVSNLNDSKERVADYHRQNMLAGQREQNVHTVLCTNSRKSPGQSRKHTERNEISSFEGLLGCWAQPHKRSLFSTDPPITQSPFIHPMDCPHIDRHSSVLHTPLPPASWPREVLREWRTAVPNTSRNSLGAGRGRDCCSC